jgi:23S rRNA (adenine2503-C2)-methyltransferase
MTKPCLCGMNLEQLTGFVTGLGQPAFRARQLMAWLVKGKDFPQMHTLPAALRKQLDMVAIAQPARVAERHVSALDGTEKYLFCLPDNHTVEGVLMCYRHGITFCLSTQVGCAMGCAFCASTLGGKLRDLSTGEMAGMTYAANALCADEGIDNIVLMGSGEPLDNYEQVIGFLRLISSPDSLHIGLRHISLSTCGLPARMRRLAREGLPVTLSVSLHAPNDDIRQQIMPIARVYPINEVLDACREYIRQTGRRVVIEYALIDGINDRVDHAEELAAKLRGMQCHVNLIPLNDVAERDLRAAGRGQVRAFAGRLGELNISATVRRQLGDDIFGACGQLRAQRLKMPLISEEEAGI